MEFLVYLAGPIRGLSYGDCVEWREHASKKFPPYIKTLSPMRYKEHLKNVKFIDVGVADHPLTRQKGVTARDRFDVMRSDLILFNFLGANEVSKGSILEIGWADAFRKPIVIAMEDNGNPHDHMMIREVAGFLVGDLDTAIETAISVLSP